MQANHSDARRCERFIPALMVAALFFVFASASKPISNSNDGSHYALTLALVFNRSFQIDPFIRLTKQVDLSYCGGHYYTDRPPGTALLAWPSAAAARWLAGANDPARPSHKIRVAALWGVNLCAALNPALIYLLLRALGCRPGAALAAGVIFALGTLNFRYGVTLYSHVPAATLVLASFLTVFALEPIGPERRAWPGAAVLGLVTGFAPAVEYLLAPLGPMLMAYLMGRWAWTAHTRSRAPGRAMQVKQGAAPRPAGAGLRMRGWWIGVPAAFLTGWLAGAAFLLFYNWTCFGHPLHTSYRYHHTFLWARSFGTTFGNPRPWRALWDLLFSLEYRGLLVTSPVFWLIGVGAVVWWRERGRRGLEVLALGVATAALVLICHHRTYFAGASRDTRYVFFAAPLLFLPVGVALDWLLRREGAPGLRTELRRLGLVMSGVAALASVLWQVRLALNFPGYEFSLGLIGPPEASVGYVERVLTCLFPDIFYWRINLAAALVVLLAGVGVGIVVERVRGARGRDAAGASGRP
ncbi:MAG: hypothetical protein Kow0059_15560 [Candidatus Sumerlaeia bacterium]